MREQGTLADWNDDRGFGFITPVAGGRRVFVHISALPRGRRPEANERVTYRLGRDERNRPNACEVLYAASRRTIRPQTRGKLIALGTALCFFGLLFGLMALGRIPMLLLAADGLFSVVGFAMYRVDKTAAKRGAWRISEVNLHTVAVVGGWPGALVARHLFRHKTTKQPFRTIFWGSVIVNCAALAWFVYAAPLG